MTNKSLYELKLENLSRILNLENTDDDPIMFIISPDLPEWVSEIELCWQKTEVVSHFHKIKFWNC